MTMAELTLALMVLLLDMLAYFTGDFFHHQLGNRSR